MKPTGNGHFTAEEIRIAMVLHLRRRYKSGATPPPLTEQELRTGAIADLIDAREKRKMREKEKESL